MENKECSKCGELKDSSLFYKHSRICRHCKNIKQREDRAKSGDSWTKKYEKSKSGFLMRSYRNMNSRVTGIQQLKFHLYEGLSILEKEVFYAWSLNNEDFHKLFEKYEKSGYELRLAPSVDRKDSTLGYELDNMRWIPHWENSQLGALSKAKRNKEKQ